jgi:hypothetical protein
MLDPESLQARSKIVETARDPELTAVVSSDWVTVAMEEYKALRVEIIDAIQAQRRIMLLGVTGLSVLIGLGLQRIPPFLAIVVLTIIVPMITLSIIGAAFGEFSRAVRASSYLYQREQVINTALGDPRAALSWEDWLRTPQMSMTREHAQFFALLVLSLGSLGVGWYTALTSAAWTSAPTALIAGFGVLTMVTWASGPSLYRHLLRKVRREFLASRGNGQP